MRANNFENMIHDAKFKIQPMDKQFEEYMDDCFGTQEEILAHKKKLHANTALICNYNFTKKK